MARSVVEPSRPSGGTRPGSAGQVPGSGGAAAEVGGATEVTGAIILELIVPWLLVTMVATALYRLSYSRAWDRDMRALGAEETNAVE